MLIQPIDGTCAPAFLELGARTGKVFYSADWMKLFEGHLQRFGVFDDQGELAAGFYLYEQRRAGLRLLCNPPFTPVIGPFMHMPAQHPVSVLEARRRILETMAEHLAHRSLAIISVSLDHDIEDALAFYWAGFKTLPHYTYLLDLSSPVDELMERFSDARRRNIAKARRDGLVTERVTNLEEIGMLARATFRRQRAHLDEQILDAILFNFAKPTNSFAFVTRRDGRPIACVFVVYDKTTAYYLLGGYDETDKHAGAGAAAMWEAIQTAKALGLATFDFEGSSIPAIERYFRGFGGQLSYYLSVNRAWLPFEIALKFWRRNQF